MYSGSVRHGGLVKDHDWDTRGTGFKSRLEAVFPAVQLPTVKWEAVAKHKRYVNVADGVFCMGHSATACESAMFAM